MSDWESKKEFGNWPAAPKIRTVNENIVNTHSNNNNNNNDKRWQNAENIHLSAWETRKYYVLDAKNEEEEKRTEWNERVIKHICQK